MPEKTVMGHSDMTYKDIYDASLADPESFWMGAAEAIDWDKKPSKATR